MNTQKLPLVSVVMPAYNCEKYLEIAVKSVLRQTYKNLEVLIINDCSKDRTADVAKELCELDSRVRLLHNEKNQGVALTRNVGITEAKGDYIALLDSDDVWTEDKIERQIELALLTSAPIVYCSYGFIDESGKEIKKPFVVPEETNFKKMLAMSVISCSTALIEAELLRSHLFDPKTFHEDYALWMEFMSMPVKAVGDPKVLAYYRQLSGSRNEKKLHAAVERWKIYRNELHLGVFSSVVAFVQYAILGVKKYYAR